MSNFKFAYMYLLHVTLVSLCNGENCRAKYRITSTCAAQYYGAISSRYLGIRSVTECATMCNNEESCRSFIYNHKKEKCRTYSFHLDNLTNNCTELVKYVALDTFEGFCFTSRVAETTSSPPRGIFDPCSINTDCGGIGAAECRHDMCQCVPLLSYEPTSNKCVAECNIYGTTFQEDLGRYLGSTNADKTQIKPTAGHCKDSCVNESLFKCRAAEYISYDNKCRLHSVDSLKSKTIDYQTSNDYDLYIRNCANTNTGTFSTTTQQSNVIEITIPPTTFLPTFIPHPPPTPFPPTTIPHTQPPTTLPPTTILDTAQPTAFPPTTIPDTPPPTTFPPTTIPDTPQPTTFPPTTIPDTPPPTTFPPTTIPDTPPPTTFPPTTIPDTPPPTTFLPTTFPDTPPPTTFPPTTIPDAPPPTTFLPTTFPDTPPPTSFPPTTIPDTPPPTTFPPTTIPDTPPPTSFPPTTFPDTPPPTTFLPTTIPDTPPPTTFPPTTIPQTQTPTSLPPTTQSSIYSSCIDDIDCEGISDAECRYGQCQCLPGLSHDPISNSCVHECTTYGVTFQDLQDHYLSYPSDDMIGDVFDPLHCLHLCIEETSYVCRVAELYHPNSYCLLYSEDTFNANDLTLNPSVSYDHYLRDCAAEPSPTPSTPSLPPTTTPPYTTNPALETSTPQSYISMSCTDDNDCMGISDAECRFGICRCIPGLSHDPFSNSCIQECASYGTTFQELQDNYLSFNSDDMVGSIAGPVECMDLCIAESSYVCRVAEFYHPNSYCLLYSVETFNAYDLTFNPSVSYDHYMRDCAAEPSPTLSTSFLPPTTTPPYTTCPPLEISAPQSYISMSCTDDNDCVGISDAECRFGICRCIPGLSHDPVSNSCIQECTTYGTTFQELQDNYLSFNSDDMIGGISGPVECMDLCIAESSYVCRVAEFYHPNSYCLLYSVETLAANTIIFNPSVSYDHYMRDCTTE